MGKPGDTFIEGLVWYLETRGWAREKMATCPHGSSLQDIKMFHYLYFANLFGAIDLVDDYLTATQGASKFAFRAEVSRQFAVPADFDYALEFRNAIVHRGLNPAGAGHSDNQTLYFLCPAEIDKRGQSQALSCTFTYTRELAAQCDQAADKAIADVLDQRGFFLAGRTEASKEDLLAAIEASSAVPDWVKAGVPLAFEQLDFDKLALEMDNQRISNIKSLLGIPNDQSGGAP